MLIRKSKRKYYFMKFKNQKNKMKETWREINTIIGKGKGQSSQSKFRGENDNVITDSQDIANHFNDFFVNVGPKLASDIQNTGKNYYDYLHNMRSSSMYMKPIVESDILKIVSNFNNVTKVLVMTISEILSLRKFKVKLLNH